MSEYCCYLQSIDEETKSQRGWLKYPVSYSYRWRSWGSDPGSVTLGRLSFHCSSVLFHSASTFPFFWILSQSRWGLSLFCLTEGILQGKWTCLRAYFTLTPPGHSLLFSGESRLIGKDPDTGERLRAGKGGDRGWNGWIVSQTQKTWGWANSRRWRGRGKPGMLQFMGWQRVKHNLATKQQSGHRQGDRNLRLKTAPEALIPVKTITQDRAQPSISTGQRENIFSNK